MPRQQVYFLSDFHLGIPDHASSLVREKRVVEFLRRAAVDAQSHSDQVRTLKI